MSFIGGIEGGATHSTFMLFSSDGKALATVEGPGTNMYQLGLEETCKRVKVTLISGLLN